MPSWRTHLAFAICAYILFIYWAVPKFLPATTMEQMLVGFFIASIASLLPDLDSEQSKINNAMQTLLMLGIIATAILWQLNILNAMAGSLIAFVLIAFLSITYFLRHRGLLHRYTFLAAIAFLLSIANVFYAVAFAIGYGSHLLLDGVELK